MRPYPPKIGSQGENRAPAARKPASNEAIPVATSRISLQIGKFAAALFRRVIPPNLFCFNHKNTANLSQKTAHPQALPLPRSGHRLECAGDRPRSPFSTSWNIRGSTRNTEEIFGIPVNHVHTELAPSASQRFQGASRKCAAPRVGARRSAGGHLCANWVISAISPPIPAIFCTPLHL